METLTKSAPVQTSTQEHSPQRRLHRLVLIDHCEAMPAAYLGHSSSKLNDINIQILVSLTKNWHFS